LRYRNRGAVNEARLDCPPRLYEARMIACRERLDVKGFDSLCALFESGLGMPHVATYLYGAGIFSATELGA